MSSLKVQEFLRGYLYPRQNCAGDWGTIALEHLKSKYAIDYKFHSKCPNLVLLKYSMIDSDFSSPVVQECRGLILDSANNWEVVAYPFKKFMNFSEPLAAIIDWRTARVQEKLDGSLITLYLYNDEWQIATSGCPDGTNKVGDREITFAELFWETFRKQGGNLDYFSPTNTYMFELTSPLNRVVVDHKEAKITLIGIRSRLTLKEEPVHPVGIIPCVVEYLLYSVDACIEAANHLNPLKQEGFVVVDANFNRIKVKGKDYVTMHHLYFSFSLRNLAEAIRNGEYDELSIALESYPDYLKELLVLKCQYLQIQLDCERDFHRLKHIESQKEFAKEALRCLNPSVLFTMRKTGKTVATIIKEMASNAFLGMMGVK
jgi:hypothetical protein